MAGIVVQLEFPSLGFEEKGSGDGSFLPFPKTGYDAPSDLPLAVPLLKVSKREEDSENEQHRSGQPPAGGDSI